MVEGRGKQAVNGGEGANRLLVEREKNGLLMEGVGQIGCYGIGEGQTGC